MKLQVRRDPSSLERFMLALCPWCAVWSYILYDAGVCPKCEFMNRPQMIVPRSDNMLPAAPCPTTAPPEQCGCDSCRIQIRRWPGIQAYEVKG